MLKKLLFGAGMAWLARRFMGGRSRRSDYSRRGMDHGVGTGRSRRRGFFGF